MNRVALASVLAAAAACSEPQSTAPTQLNLDRPVDLSFACYGGLRITDSTKPPLVTDPVKLSAQPQVSCDLRSEDHTDSLGNLQPEHRPRGQEDIAGSTVDAAEWFGFILESAPGTVAISHWATKPSAQFLGGDTQVLDADPLTPGKNAISIGEEPIAIATDYAGCFEVTANAGSCDLSTLEINSAVDNHVINGVTVLDASTPLSLNRLQVKNTAGTPILSRPAAMVAQPTTTAVGKECPVTASGLVYIAYPSCHLVAAVNAATGTMVAGIKFDATGARLTPGNDVCPKECADDQGKVDIVAPGPRPVTLAVVSDGGRNRLAIGADNAASFAIVDVDPTVGPTGTVTQIPLQDPTGKLGITAIALSPQILLGGADELVHEGDVPPPAGPRGQYIYGVASDHTVRVADVLNANHECDTQVDSRYLRSIKNVPLLQCLPVGDPTLPRRSGARSAGIELIGDGVPTSVAFFTAPPINVPGETDTDNRVGPNRMIGHYAIITATSGVSFVVNVNDVGRMPLDNLGRRLPDDVFSQASPQATSPTVLIAHQLRDNALKLDAVGTPPTVAPDDLGVQSCADPGPTADLGGGNIGGPRLTSSPVRNVIPGPQAVGLTKISTLPSLRQFRCANSSSADVFAISEMQLQNDAQTRDQIFPDLRALFSDEAWTMTYEGLLSADTPTSFLDGPPVRDGQLFVDALGMYLRDPGKPFCEIGAEQFDSVQLRGCNPGNGNGDCPAGYTCFVHPQTVVPDGSVAIGQCMLSTEADRLATACRDFLTTSRRYTIGQSTSGQLTLLPRKHELRTTPVDGCTTDAQCQELANFAAQTTSTADPFTDRTPVDPHTWSCQTDTARAPINTDPTKNKRCIQTCVAATDCDAGSLCQAGVCMESVIPPPACVTGPQRYDVRASEAFTLIGSRSGYVHPFIADSTGKCIRDPAASPQQIGRIPLKAPACDPTADPITGKLPGGGFEANPCATTVTNASIDLKYSTPDSTTTPCATSGTQVVERMVPAIKFRNRGFRLTLVDPTYPGDAKCIGDRLGGRVGIPVTFPGYQMTFRVTGGFAPMVLPSITPVFPVKVVAGPTNSIWVVDDGDFLSTSITVASTRGKVFRVEATNLFGINLLQ